MSKPRAVLVGPPGAGKSTIGRRLANALGTDVYDTDLAIEHETGRTIPEIFATDGEPVFREIEERIVIESLTSRSGIVSLGGGAILSQRTRAALQGHVVVYLEISVGEGLRRTGSHASRPLLAGADPRTKYRELMRRRRPLYRGVATIRVRTDGRSPSRVVAQILSKLGAPPSPPPEPPRLHHHITSGVALPGPPPTTTPPTTKPPATPPKPPPIATARPKPTDPQERRK